MANTRKTTGAENRLEQQWRGANDTAVKKEHSGWHLSLSLRLRRKHTKANTFWETSRMFQIRFDTGANPACGLHRAHEENYTHSLRDFLPFCRACKTEVFHKAFVWGSNGYIKSGALLSMSSYTSSSPPFSSQHGENYGLSMGALTCTETQPCDRYNRNNKNQILRSVPIGFSQI